MTDHLTIRVPYESSTGTVTISAEDARRIVAMALADICHPLNEHERRIAALEKRADQEISHGK